MPLGTCRGALLALGALGTLCTITGQDALQELKYGMCDPAHTSGCVPLQSNRLVCDRNATSSPSNCTCPPTQGVAPQIFNCSVTLKNMDTSDFPFNGKMWVHSLPCASCGTPDGKPGPVDDDGKLQTKVCARDGTNPGTNRTEQLGVDPGYIFSLSRAGTSQLVLELIPGYNPVPEPDPPVPSRTDCNLPLTQENQWPQYVFNVHSTPLSTDPAELPGVNWLWGGLLCEISAALYACGICLQRYALTLKEQSSTARPSIAGMNGAELEGWHPSGGSRVGLQSSVHARLENAFRDKNRATIIWGCGFFLWGFGNSVYAYGLQFAPLSLMTSLFATVLIFNGLMASVFLGEEVRKADVVSWCLIFAGISICGIFLAKKKEENCCTADQLFNMAEKPLAVTFQAMVVGLIIVIIVFIYFFERGDTARPAGTPYPMTIIVGYPCVVALFESLCQLCIDGLSSMWHQTTLGNSQLHDPGFYIVLGMLALFSLAVMYWMRRGYARFEAVTMLPIQMGVLIGFTVVGGLMFYDEYSTGGMTPNDLVMTFVGVGFIIFGISVGARAKFARALATSRAGGLQASLSDNVAPEEVTTW